MSKLKVGVIGTGHLGKLHTKMFRSIENCELIGIYDSNLDQAKAVSEEFGVPSVTSLEDLLKGKIWAYSDEERRKSKRQKDLADIMRLIETYPNLAELLPEKIKKLLG